MDIDIVFFENAIDVAPVAMKLRGKPIHGASFGHFVEYGFYPLAYLHRIYDLLSAH